MHAVQEIAYFKRIAGRRFIPQPSCGGAWTTSELHISPVNGLLAHELERWLASRPDDGLRVSRLSLDYLGVFDFSECEVTVEVLRPGRAVELVEAVVAQHGRPALRGRAWRLATADTRAVAGGQRPTLAPPHEGRPHDLTAVWPGGYIQSIEMRALESPVPGRTTAWLTTRLPIVAGDATGDLAHFVLLVDTTNGIAVRESPDAWQFPNLDLTIHLLRAPRGRWVGFETRVAFGPGGHGITMAHLHDEAGHVGLAAQSLIVRPRAGLEGRR